MSKRHAERFPIFSLCADRIGQMLAIVETDVRKLRHDPLELMTRMIQPAIWLLIFGQSMAHARAIPTGAISYLDYMTPGILAQSTLFISIFFGISLIWERDIGILQKILVSPTPRSILVIGRALAAGIRGVSQIFIIYFLAIMLGINLRWNPLAILGVIVTVMLGGAIFSTFSLIIACIVKKRERFMGIGQVLTMPLFFASNALYPISMMPKWLQVVSILNPLTYQVNALRNFMIIGDESTYSSLALDFGVGIASFVLLVIIATRIYPRILY